MAVVSLREARARRAARQPRPAELVARRGYAPLYAEGCRCPGCAASAWIVGRFSAECARCGCALPLGPEAQP